jgi:hypothetical protein
MAARMQRRLRPAARPAATRKTSDYVMEETVGIVIFSAFMVLVIGLLVGNLLFALYRERRSRRAAGDAQAGPVEE